MVTSDETIFRAESYQFDLPEELIAQVPLEPRHASRLLVVNRSQKNWHHRRFADLPDILNSDDVLVANNSKVIRARLIGRRILNSSSHDHLGGAVEFLMLEQMGPRVWEGMFRSSAKHKAGLEFEIPLTSGGTLRGKLIRGSDGSPHGTVVAEFDQDPIACNAGIMPLPPYIERPDQGKVEDFDSYQTVYAKNDGSAAAPTAGLHFTSEILKNLELRGVGWEELTLHVGLGTFRPVKEQDIRQHSLHEERYWIESALAERLRAAKAAGRRIVCVGTTAVRSLESAYDSESLVRAGPGRTSLFIRPGEYSFKVVDRLLTNFHLPRSTLLMLVCAFAGNDLILKAYQDAVKQKYRFFSYGDCMLIL